jgi:hypothetical protein
MYTVQPLIKEIGIWYMEPICLLNIFRKSHFVDSRKK